MNRATVLVVEDDPEILDVLEFNLRTAGYRVLRAEDGLTACRLVGAETPDLIFLDVMLPDLEGWEICRMIRAHRDPRVASTPLVMLTALGTVEHKLRGLALGADDYIPKPFSVQEVLLKARRLVDARREADRIHDELRRSEERRAADADLQGLLFHELKNKLVVVGGFSRRLASLPGVDPRSGRYAQAVGEAAGYLSDLAEQVLLLRRLEAGRLDLALEDVDLADVVRSVAALHRAPAQEKGVEIVVEAAAVAAQVSPTAARVCVSNLLENALSYSPDGGAVRLRVGAEPRVAFVEVEDEGPGIPREEAEAVFEKFYRGITSRSTGGTGLGLYVVRTLAAAMGGWAYLLPPRKRGTRARLEFRPASSEGIPRDPRGETPGERAGLSTPPAPEAPSLD
jgi:signal transduction histidine kinase